MTNLSIENAPKGYLYFGDGEVEEVSWANFFSDQKIGFTRIDAVTYTGTYICIRLDNKEGHKIETEETWYRRNNYDDHGMPIYDEIDILRIELFKEVE